LKALKQKLKGGKAVLSAELSNVALGKRLLIIPLIDQPEFYSATPKYLIK